MWSSFGISIGTFHRARSTTSATYFPQGSYLDYHGEFQGTTLSAFVTVLRVAWVVVQCLGSVCHYIHVFSAVLGNTSITEDPTSVTEDPGDG